jgi:hypothetical protein
VKIANEGKTAEEDEIDVNRVIMPRVTDLRQACRLMYHAISSLRIAICDGQHRMAAMLELLTGWTIKIESSKIPPKAFVRVVDDEKERKARDEFEPVMLQLGEKVTVRIFFPETDDLEAEGQKYSLIREVSQSHHKRRGLVDV